VRRHTVTGLLERLNRGEELPPGEVGRALVDFLA
jgi:hypothetical protein